MEEKKQPEHKCNICWYYTPFYVKKETCFEKLKDGYCRKCEQSKNHFDGCGQWKYGPHRRMGSKRIIERVLRDMLEHLAAISQILQEYNDESNKSER